MQQFLFSPSDVIATTCFANRTIGDYYGNHNSWLHIQLIKLLPLGRIAVTHDHLCGPVVRGLVVRVPGYGSRGPGYLEAVGLEQGSLSLVSTIEKLLERKSSGSSLEIREYCRRDPSRWPRGTHYLQKLALISPKSCGCSVGIVCLQTQATEFNF
jgi:hypothetical protein